eukprot:9764603-Heterocapsa_arctica.AAC.1
MATTSRPRRMAEGCGGAMGSSATSPRIRIPPQCQRRTMDDPWWSLIVKAEEQAPKDGSAPEDTSPNIDGVLLQLLATREA